MTAIVSLSDVWDLPGSGSWSTSADWSLGAAPRSNSSVEIAPAAPLDVTFDVGNLAIDSLVLDDATLTLSGGALTLEDSAEFVAATLNGAKPLALFGAATVEGLSLGGSVVVYNYGAVTQSAGTVTVGDSSASSAAIRNTANATWTITDASYIAQAPGATGWGFVNLGEFDKTSNSGVALITANFDSTGIIASAGGGDIEFDGAKTSLSGTYIGSGMVDYGPDGVAMVGAVDVTQSSCQTNWGVVDLIGVMTMNDGSTIMNAQGAHWNFDGDSSLLLATGDSAGPDINGMGTIAKTAGTGTSTVGIDVETMGVVTAATGTLDFIGASSAFASVINGAGTFEIGGGAADLQMGASLLVSHWTLAGGTTTLGETLAYTGAFTGQSGATLDADDYVLTLTGASVLSGLAVDGPGGLTLRAGATVTGLTVTGGAALRDFGYVTQSSGEVTLGDSVSTDVGNLYIGYGGSWGLEGASGIALGADPNSEIMIGTGAGSGVLSKVGTGVSVVAPNVVNDGVNIPEGVGYEPRGLNVEAGTLDIHGAISGTGSDNIDGTGSNNFLTESTLEFDGSVSAGQTIDFSGVGAALFVNDLAAFHGAITNFSLADGGNSLLIGGGYAFEGASETATSTTLSFLSASHTTSTLTLTGDYQGHSFAATSAGTGVIRVM